MERQRPDSFDAAIDPEAESTSSQDQTRCESGDEFTAAKKQNLCAPLQLAHHFSPYVLEAVPPCHPDPRPLHDPRLHRVLLAYRSVNVRRASPALRRGVEVPVMLSRTLDDRWKDTTVDVARATRFVDRAHAVLVP